MSLIIKKNTTFKIPRTAVAPTTLPLGTPTLYFSGISLADDAEYSGMTFDNPWGWFAFSNQWNSSNFISQLYYSAGAWNFFIQGYRIEFGFIGTRLACTNTAPSTSLPLFGWVNQSWVTGGTLVISTTP
jgi:hypothetical protein